MLVAWHALAKAKGRGDEQAVASKIHFQSAYEINLSDVL